MLIANTSLEFVQLSNYTWSVRAEDTERRKSGKRRLWMDFFSSFLEQRGLHCVLTGDRGLWDRIRGGTASNIFITQSSRLLNRIPHQRATISGILFSLRSGDGRYFLLIVQETGKKWQYLISHLMIHLTDHFSHLLTQTAPQPRLSLGSRSSST